MQPVSFAYMLHQLTSLVTGATATSDKVLVFPYITCNNSILLTVHSFMENFSTPHCTESETHDVCVDYAMQGIFTDHAMQS